MPTDPLADLPPGEGDSTALFAGPRQAASRLVLLHGWGADADDLLDLGPVLLGADPASIGLSVVALRAPLPHPAGLGRQWYDLQQPEWPQLPEARRALRQRLLALGTSVPLEHTCLLGFSQGAAMAIDVATGGGPDDGDPLPLAGLVACSGYPHPDWQPQTPRTAILLTHGEQDPVVPFAASVALERSLAEAGGSVQRIAFPGGHSIDAELIAPMREFLVRGWQGR
ncbi:alpha/beta hydrolase [Aphanothece minutissima]|uniref:Esterase n=1 Tax=Aphanothece cf. minutissima CCALA 015 TaxID=2107695 RepID=A0ABX5F9B9_9CHRO|nr:esterase [Aphanothece minutissima]PSB37637.1 esterase [Aphanothece cf. minutissima CCALA 015]